MGCRLFSLDFASRSKGSKFMTGGYELEAHSLIKVYKYSLDSRLTDFNLAHSTLTCPDAIPI